MKLIPGAFSSSHQQLILRSEGSRIPQDSEMLSSTQSATAKSSLTCKECAGESILTTGCGPLETDTDHRHSTPADHESWHLVTLMIRPSFRLRRYREHPNTVSFQS
jgi:hypothetical protein